MSRDRIDVKPALQRHALMIDYNGKLAYTWGWNVSKEKPEENRQLKVSKFKASQWSDLVDKYIEDWTGNIGIIYAEFHSRPVRIFAEDFSEIVTETRPIPRPRRGKDQWGKYDWRYVGDGYFNPYWEKVYLPTEE
jgi:hypothetical protein